MKCEPPCEKCENSSDNCTSCMDSKILFENTCKDYCQSGFT